jgi:hypothetical protein
MMDPSLGRILIRTSLNSLEMAMDLGVGSAAAGAFMCHLIMADGRPECPAQPIELLRQWQLNHLHTLVDVATSSSHELQSKWQ